MRVIFIRNSTYGFVVKHIRGDTTFGEKPGIYSPIHSPVARLRGGDAASTHLMLILSRTGSSSSYLAPTLLQIPRSGGELAAI